MAWMGIDTWEKALGLVMDRVREKWETEPETTYVSFNTPTVPRVFAHVLISGGCVTTVIFYTHNAMYRLWTWHRDGTCRIGPVRPERLAILSDWGPTPIRVAAESLHIMEYPTGCEARSRDILYPDGIVLTDDNLLDIECTNLDIHDLLGPQARPYRRWK